ncbi:HAMP domain-containing histidine kinase [Methylobacterium sp. WL6]|nr:HAMP domain-containing histidine kinase [Methylobacterium sp. WL6]
MRCAGVSAKNIVARAPREKWRPTLGLVVLALLLSVAALPLLGLSFVRLYENQLVRQAEGELIGQTMVLATVIAREIATDPARDMLLGPVVPKADPAAIEPALDLTTDPILGRRPSAADAPSLSLAPAALGTRLAPLLPPIRAVTLAGFRVLDRDGIVLAGGDEVGRSLAGVEEVATALQGRFRAVMRVRISKHPPPPLYAISRGTSVRVFVAMPVLVDGRIAGVVYASRTPDNVVRLLYGERGKVVLALLMVMVLTGTVALVFTRAIGRPITALKARAAAIGQGAPVTSAPEARFGTREIAALAHSFETMALRLRERSDYVATFANHVSHELKTPLTAIQGAAELLQEDEDGLGSAMSMAERRRFLANIVADANRLNALLRRLRELARAETASPAGHTTLREITADLIARFAKIEIRAEGTLEQLLPLSPEDAGIVFGHLADNAARHGASTLRLDVTIAGDMHCVRIVDDGRGIPIRDRERVFEPFYTTRRVDGGTGMGLSIVRAILQGRGGSIAVVPVIQGTAFEIRLPHPSKT